MSNGAPWSLFVIHHTDCEPSQTSIRSGNIIGMGKGFHCSTSKGADLGDIIEQACQRAVGNIVPVAESGH